MDVSRRLLLLIAVLALFITPLRPEGVAEGEFGAAKPGDKAGKRKAEAETPSQKKPKSSSATSARRYPYYGALHSADAAGRTITLAGKKKQRVILITPETNITRNGKPVPLKEALTGEKVSGSVIKNPDGKEEAITLRLNGQTEPVQPER